ncbi:MAG: ATP-binding protein [Desulfococcaceae bacterium]|jgi:signal transduction histidine kinase|nr:ATP-binding protein [Desulfococcaceae bacterium]
MSEQQKDDTSGKLRILAKKLIHAREKERKRISRELHDSIGSGLTAIRFALERKLEEFGNEPCRKKTCIEDILDMLHTVSSEVSRISKNLHPAILEDLGLCAAVRSHCRQFCEFYPDLDIHQEMNLDESGITDELKTLIYRIIQEALSNVAKHSGADKARISIRQDSSRIALSISDNGCGFDVGNQLRESPADSGFGLFSIIERTELFGGTSRIESAPEKGTYIQAVWPL